MKYYAIADLHGRYDLLLEAINKIYDHAGKDEYKIITLGDYIDRGPQSKEVIEHLMGRTGDTICLKGNHEDMAVQVAADRSIRMLCWWVGNGGDATFKSYGEPGIIDNVNPDHIKWMANLPIYFETDKQLFVHAGVPQNGMNLPPKTAHAYKDMMWMLYSFRTAGGWKGKHVVHGHHQFADGPHVWHGPKGGRTDLDTFAWKTGRLVVGVFDDTQGPAIDYIEIKDTPYGPS
jgi:serine/threonine protein phosphatase 1